jgi:mono/diheme cytochrome c family protein
MLTPRWTLAPIGGVLVAAAGFGLSAWAQHAGHAPPTASEPRPDRPEPIRITMEALHRAGGVPPGWKFAVPPGNPGTGRQVFVELECFSCHRVGGESFTPRQVGDVGPELNGIGGPQPTENQLESILNPNAVIVEGPGFTGPDRLSKMPDYGDSLTVGQLIDLVAYLKSLTGGEPEAGRHQAAPAGDHGAGRSTKGH